LSNLTKKLAIFFIFTISFFVVKTIHASEEKKLFVPETRVMLDTGSVIKSKTSDLHDDVLLRRAWLGASGYFSKDWRYRLTYGSENERFQTIDAFLGYEGIKDSEILIGSFFENNGIDAGTTNLIHSFMERDSSLLAFRNVRRVGASYNYFKEDWSYRIGVFGGDAHDSLSNNKGWSVSSRFYFLPINNLNTAHHLHLGFNASYRTPESLIDNTRFNSGGNTVVITKRLVDTGVITDVDNTQFFSPEFRYQKGPFTLTSEYFKTNVNRNGSDLSFAGYYVMSSYFLTDSHYKYSVKNGTPSSIVNQKGAFELASKFSNLDLNNKDVVGGKLKSYDFGLNYYLDDSTKFMINYIYNRVKRSDLINKNPQYLMLRFQLWY